MNGQPMVRTVTIKDPQGLHMRPAMAIAKRAREFQSNVVVRVDDRTANAKSQLELMMLAAEPGATLVIEVSGADAEAALATVADLIEAVSAEGAEDQSGPPPPKG